MNVKMPNKCRFCSSEDTKYSFSSFNTHGKNIVEKKERFPVYKCLDCGCLFIPNIEVGDNYYEKYYEVSYYLENGENKSTNRCWASLYKFLFSKIKEKYIRRYFKGREKLSILDIGCGRGGFLLSLDSDIFEKNGIEINPEGVEICRRKKIDVYNKPVELINFGEKKFDVITLWHVMEHLEKPMSLFKKAREIIKDNGILVFQVPNNKSLGFRFGKENWFHLDSPRHLNIPNRSTIYKACARNKLKVVSIKNEFYDYPLDLFWSIRKSPIKFLIYPLYPLFKFFSNEDLTFICKKY
ncbi:MAG: class I SAM-dependent methyltransferase [Patescibacteria group bacterium]